MTRWLIVFFAFIVSVFLVQQTTPVSALISANVIETSLRNYVITLPKDTSGNPFTSIIPLSNHSYYNETTVVFPRLYGARWTIDLTLNPNIINPDNYIELIYNFGINTTLYEHPNCFYSGTVREYPVSVVSLSTCHDKLDGFWRVGGTTYYITTVPVPLRNSPRANNRLAVLVFRSTDIIPGSDLDVSGLQCALNFSTPTVAINVSQSNPTNSINPTNPINSINPTNPVNPTNTTVSPTIGFRRRRTLRQFTKRNGNLFVARILASHDGTTDCTSILAAISGAMRLFSNLSDMLQITVVRCLQRINGFPETGTPLSEILSRYYPWVQLRRSNHTMAIDFSSLEIANKTMGYAQLGSVCRNDGLSAAVVRIPGLLDYNIAFFAHEFAHLLGAPHDGTGSSASCSPNTLTGLMTQNFSGPTSTSSASSLSFSPCSQAGIESLLSNPCNAPCLSPPSLPPLQCDSCSSYPINLVNGGPWTDCSQEDQALRSFSISCQAQGQCNTFTFNSFPLCADNAHSFNGYCISD